MPWRRDETLLVSEELPAGFIEDQLGLSNHREAQRRPMIDHAINFLHHCERCGGWIDGVPHDFPVNTLEPRRLSGRRGTEFHCRRCGSQIGFSGVMS